MYFFFFKEYIILLYAWPNGFRIIAFVSGNAASFNSLDCITVNDFLKNGNIFKKTSYRETGKRQSYESQKMGKITEESRGFVRAGNTTGRRNGPGEF